MHVFEAGHYRDEIERLRQLPELQQMAADIRPVFEANPELFRHAPGEPRFGLMRGCAEELRRRTGQAGDSIGGPARALLSLLEEP